jgi:hypothetical protein
MNNQQQHQDMFYDQAASRSPNSHRVAPQTLHRQPSRQFDAYNQMPNTLYGPEDHSRYDTNRYDRMNPVLQGGGYGYELPQAQTWNPNAFGGGHGFNAFGATGRMKAASRGRSGLPAVSVACLSLAMHPKLKMGRPGSTRPFPPCLR